MFDGYSWRFEIPLNITSAEEIKFLIYREAVRNFWTTFLPEKRDYTHKTRYAYIHFTEWVDIQIRWVYQVLEYFKTRRRVRARVY